LEESIFFITLHGGDHVLVVFKKFGRLNHRYREFSHDGNESENARLTPKSFNFFKNTRGFFQKKEKSPKDRSDASTLDSTETSARGDGFPKRRRQLTPSIHLNLSAMTAISQLF
jgi:hypothetical protein